MRYSGIVLVNIAHLHRRPRSARPAFRVLGVFASLDEAAAHVQGWQHDADVHAVPLGAYFAIARSDGLDEAAHKEALLKEHRKRVLERRDEFEAKKTTTRQSARDEACAAAGDAAGDAEGAEDAQWCLEGTVVAGEPVVQVPQALEIKLQNFALISVLEDRQGDQPCVCVHRVFNTEQEAITYGKDVLSKYVTDYHIDTIAMYVWCYPCDPIDDDVAEEFRVEELTKIAAQRKRGKREVEAFREECQRKGIPVPEIVIGATADVAGSDVAGVDVAGADVAGADVAGADVAGADGTCLGRQGSAPPALDGTAEVIHVGVQH
jgi:hypothetical protein